MEEAGSQALLPRDLRAAHGGGLRAEGAGARPGDLLQQQQEPAQRVSGC